MIKFSTYLICCLLFSIFFKKKDREELQKTKTGKDLKISKKKLTIKTSNLSSHHEHYLTWQ